MELFNANNKLLVFEWPEEGYDYSVGVDNSGGTKQDNSVLAVNRHSLRGNEPDAIVSMWASNNVNPANIHTYGLAIAALYRVDGMPKGEPLVGIEQVYGMGDVMQPTLLRPATPARVTMKGSSSLLPQFNFTAIWPQKTLDIAKIAPPIKPTIPKMAKAAEAGPPRRKRHTIPVNAKTIPAARENQRSGGIALITASTAVVFIATSISGWVGTSV